jgi:hypothetical protein
LREILINALSLGFEVAKLVLVCLITGRISLAHTVFYDACNQTHDQAKEIKAFIVAFESETAKV